MTNILGAFFLVIFSWCQVLAEQANENVFPICLESDELWNAVAVENPTKNTQPLHVGVLPSTVGSSFQITLHENSSIPTLDYTDTLSSTDGSVSKIPPLSYCYLRLEACSHCNIHLEYESPLHYLNDTESDQLLACHELGHIHQPCFSLEFVEERGDRAIGLLNSFETEVHSRSSLRSNPSFWLTTSSNSLLLIARMRNPIQNKRLNAYLTKLFPITAYVIDNTEVITGQASKSIFAPNQKQSIGFIQSPRYPDVYPRNLLKNYTLVNENPMGFVRLIFEDFRVHFKSALKIIDSDGKVLFDLKDDYRRPPATLSKGNRLTVIFETNDFVQEIGFRARFEFVDSEEWTDRPVNFNCDGYLEGYGGRITLDSYNYLPENYVDCIWLVGRFPSLSRTYDRISLRVEEFRLRGVGLRLEVRRGHSSTSERVLLLFDEQSKAQLEHKQPIGGFVTEDRARPAFYIRLRGYLSSTSGLNIVYAQYYRWATASCPGGEDEFHCDNSKCIKKAFTCDGFDHCGDDSDEVCQKQQPTFEDRHVDVTGVLALVVSAAGIFIVLLVIVAVLSRIYRGRPPPTLVRSRSPRNNNGNLSPVAQEAAYQNELAPSIQTVGERRFYVLPERNISVIEAPPTYDDALKHPVAITHRVAYHNTAFEETHVESEFMETAVHTQHEVGMPSVRPIKSSPAHRNNQMPTNQPNTIAEPADMNANSSLLLTTPDLANSSAHQVVTYDSSIEEEIEIEIEDPIQNEPDQTPSNEMTNERMINMIETWV